MEKTKALYSKGEEIFNGVTHIIGGGLGILFLIFACIYGGLKINSLQTISLIVYSISMIVLYTMSTLYHMISHTVAKKVFRILDHCTIYFLIAGTYTPYIILGIPSINGYIVLLIEWLLAIIGITFNAINMNWKAVKILSYISYVVMGWCIVIIFNELIQINPVSLWLLLAGGICYTGGFIFYGIGKTKKWFHSIWHIFVLLGTICHFISVIFLMINC